MPQTAKLVALYKSFKGFDTIYSTVKFIKAENGNCLASIVVEQKHANSFGGLHGGFASTLIDAVSTLGLLVLPSRKEMWFPSVKLNISFLKAAKIGDEILIDSKLIKNGNSLAFLNIEVRNKVTNELLIKGEHIKFYFEVPLKNV